MSYLDRPIFSTSEKSGPPHWGSDITHNGRPLRAYIYSRAMMEDEDIMDRLSRALETQVIINWRGFVRWPALAAAKLLREIIRSRARVSARRQAQNPASPSYSHLLSKGSRHALSPFKATFLVIVCSHCFFDSIHSPWP